MTGISGLQLRADIGWSVLIILAASLTVSSLVSAMIGYVIVLGVYVAFIGWSIFTDQFAVVYHWAIALLLGVIWTVFAVTTALDPTGAGILRLAAFTVITGLNIFVIPAIIDETTLQNALAYTAGLFVSVGLPTVIIGTYGIGGIIVEPWNTSQEFFNIVIQTPVSIFDNPNYLSAAAALGTVAAGAKYRRSQTSLAAGLVGLNMLGVILAGGRAALLALVCTSGLYVVYRLYGRRATGVAVGLGALAVVVGFAMVFGLLPGPNLVADVNIGDRQATWTAAYKAVLDRPVLGWGPGDDSDLLADYLADSTDAYTTHNSYIRLFLISGVLGGVAYLALSIAAIILGLRNQQSEPISTVLLLMMFLVLQLFSGATIFGLSLTSVLGALFVGYTQSSVKEAVRVEIPSGILWSGSNHRQQRER